MDSPQYKMRFWLGGYFECGMFFEAVTVDFLGTENEWIQSEQYDSRDYGT